MSLHRRFYNNMPTSTKLGSIVGKKLKYTPHYKNFPSRWRVNNTQPSTAPRTILPTLQSRLAGQIPRIGAFGLLVSRTGWLRHRPMTQYQNARAPIFKNKIKKIMVGRARHALQDYEGANKTMAAKMPFPEFRFYGTAVRRFTLYKSLNGYRSQYAKKQAEDYVASKRWPHPYPYKPYNMADNISPFRKIPNFYARK